MWPACLPRPRRWQRRRQLKRPGHYPHAELPERVGPAVLRFLAVPAGALAVLAAYHLPTEDALHAVRGLRAIVHGFVALEAAGGFGLPLDLDESFCRLVDAYVRDLERPRDAAIPGRSMD